MLRAPWLLLGMNSRGLFVGISTQLFIDLVLLTQANTNSDHEPDVACHGQPKHILLFSKRNFKTPFFTRQRAFEVRFGPHPQSQRGRVLHGDGHVLWQHRGRRFRLRWQLCKFKIVSLVRVFI